MIGQQLKRCLFKSACVPKKSLVAIIPPFSIKNPNAMDALKKHGVSIMKELLMERMHTYVLKTLIPMIMARDEPQGSKEDIDKSQQDDELLTLPAELSQGTISHEVQAHCWLQ